MPGLKDEQWNIIINLKNLREVTSELERLDKVADRLLKKGIDMTAINEVVRVAIKKMKVNESS